MLLETDNIKTINKNNSGTTGALIAEALGDLLQEHNGQDVVVLDLRNMNNWTDFFVIATAASKTHMGALERHVKEFCRERDIEILRTSGIRKPADTGDEQWSIIDIGRALIHLMNTRAREFYELERLWRPA